MNTHPILADAQGAIVILLGMVFLPILFSVLALLLAALPKKKERAIVALALALVGLVSGGALLLLTGFPKSSGWLDLTTFLQVPLGVIAVGVSLFRLKKEPIKSSTAQRP